MERKKLELGVGVFLLIGVLSLAYLSFNLGKVELFGTGAYDVHAVFSDIGGLKKNADVTMAGVAIGAVKNIQLKNEQAYITLGINDGVKLEDDAIASIKTSGLIGDKYIAISPGASDKYIPPGGTIHETQTPMDIESLIGKFVFGGVEKGKDEKKDDLGAPNLLDNQPPVK